MSGDIEDIMLKYKHRLSLELGEEKDGLKPTRVTSREYEQFKSEILPDHYSLYEKLCNKAEQIIKIRPDEKKSAIIQNAINTAHLNCTPTGTASLAILLPLMLVLVGTIFSFLIPAMFGHDYSKFFLIFTLITGISVMLPLQRFPEFLANSWRMRASNQMVLSIFYVVTYMRHTSNLELAIEFASNHLSGPLALDLKKVLWDVETEKYSTIKESLDEYLQRWRKWNLEFVESVHLVESSLYEGSESRRLDLLDKALNVILEETYEKMLHYAQNLKGPITTLHMLGIILPILGLVILPLVVNFMGNVRWYYLAAIYNVALPIGVYYLGKTILAQRPTGYGDSSITEDDPSMQKYKITTMKIFGKEVVVNPLHIALLIGVVLFMIGMIPIILHSMGLQNIGFGADVFDDTNPCKKDICFLTYKENSDLGTTVGPFDHISSILSMFFPLSLALSIGLFYRLKSKNIIHMRKNAKALEQEFASALFQLGNRLGDGLPAEIAFEKTAEIMQDTVSGKFFRQVSINIQKMGMNVAPAIFDIKAGAIRSYPSKMIESSMKVLIQSIKKGPLVAAQALINISRYLKEMHRVSERLKDLLAEVITSMKSQINMLTPIIAGIVVGITSMITNILGKLTPLLQQKAMEDQAMSESIPDFFGDGIPTFYFQIVVGLYVIQIIYILTILSNGIENGSDKLNEHYMLGRNLIRSGILYCVVAIAIMIAFNIIADIVVDTTFT